jgi:hypothetical protein
LATFGERLAAVDATTLTPLVRRALQDDSVAVTDIAFAPLAGGFARSTVGGRGTFRFSGTAGSKPWSLILKVLGRKNGTGSDDPREWNYWKREILAYQSGLLTDLPEGIAAPRCFAVTERPDDEYWIWLEDALSGPHSWDIAHYARAARDLGRFNGAYLAGLPIPDRPWFTRGRVRNWLDLGRPILDDLSAHLAGRSRRHWLTSRTAEAVSALWKAREPMLAALDALPKSLCHHDAFTRNLFVGTSGTTAIDWQIMGTGAPGEEIMPLICVSVQFMHVPPAKAAELEEAVFESYVDGLRDAGWRGPERDVRLGYTTAAALWGGVATVGMWPEMSDPRFVRDIESMIGAPIDAIVDCWAEMQEHFLKLGAEAALLMERR